MKLRTKIIKHREKENSGSSGGGKRKAEACAPTSQPRPLQRARCGLNAEQKDAEIQQGATGPAAAEDDAQAALLQRVALAFGGEQCDRQCLPARQQQQQEQQHLPPVVPPETSPAPALHIVCSGEEAQWLDVMRLPPLVDLRALPAGLEAPGYGWPSGTGTPRLVGVPRTPAGLIFVPLGTPLSQHRPLPTPAFLDFGGPAVPPTQDHWRNRQHPPSPCVGGAADATATPQGHPAGGSVVVAQASAAPADILVPNAARRQQCVPRISELLASLPIYSPSRSAPSAAAAAGLPAGAAPRLRAVLPASASRTQLQQQRSPSPDSQAREPSRRARRQRAQSSEFHWSEYGEEEEEEEEGGGGALMWVLHGVPSCLSGTPVLAWPAAPALANLASWVLHVSV